MSTNPTTPIPQSSRPTAAAAGSDTPAPEPAQAPAAAPSSPAGRVQPPRRTGPAPVSIVVGLVGLLVALGAGFSASTDLDPDWASIIPLAVVAVGLVIVVLGLAGLRSQRRS